MATWLRYWYGNVKKRPSSGVARGWLGGFLSGWLGVGSEVARGWLGGFASWWLGGGSEVARGWFKHVRGIIKNKKKCGV